MLEYEAVLKRPEHLLRMRLETHDIDRLLDNWAALVEPVVPHFSLSRKLSRRGGAPLDLVAIEKTEFNDSIRIAFGKSLRSSFHQVDPLSCPEDDPLVCLDIAGYRPQAESHVERIDAQGAPERQFSELMLQRVAAAAERHGIAIRRLHSCRAVRSGSHMCGLRGSCGTAGDTGKLSDKG